MITTIAVAALSVAALSIAALLRKASTKPDTFRVQRSATIEAPPERIFPLINDFHAWGAWSPYEHLDPAMRRAHSGAPSGTGAVYAWESKGRAGAGRMEIVESSPPSRIVLRLDLRKPVETRNDLIFTLEPRGDSTTVTWAMQGPNSFLGKVVQTLVDMDRVVGKDFEAGLAILKEIAEKQSGSGLAVA